MYFLVTDMTSSNDYLTIILNFPIWLNFCSQRNILKFFMTLTVWPIRQQGK